MNPAWLRSIKNVTDGSIGINTLAGGLSSGNLYSGSSITPTSSDFMGDWRSVDSWM